MPIENDDVQRIIYDSIKKALEFDEDKFYFNKGDILIRSLKPAYDKLGISERMTLEEFQNNIEAIGDELAQTCNNSSVGKNLLRTVQHNRDRFIISPKEMAQLNKKHFSVGIKRGPGAYEVVRSLTEKIEEISRKNQSFSDSSNSEIEKDIKSIRDELNEFKKIAGTQKMQKSGALAQYEGVCNGLIEGLRSVQEISRKTQDFATNKDDFLQNLSSDMRRSIGNRLMSKIKDFLEALGLKFTRSPEHLQHKTQFERFEHKTQSFVEKILEERKTQNRTQYKT